MICSMIPQRKMTGVLPVRSRSAASSLWRARTAVLLSTPTSTSTISSPNSLTLKPFSTIYPTIPVFHQPQQRPPEMARVRLSGPPPPSRTRPQVTPSKMMMARPPMKMSTMMLGRCLTRFPPRHLTSSKVKEAIFNSSTVSRLVRRT